MCGQTHSRRPHEQPRERPALGEGEPRGLLVVVEMAAAARQDPGVGQVPVVAVAPLSGLALGCSMLFLQPGAQQ